MTQDRNEQFALLWTAAQPTVAGYIHAALGDYHQAQDVLQQTAVALVRKFDQYDPDRPFAAWAIGVARLELLAHRRQFATDRHQFSEKLIDQLADGYASMTPQLNQMDTALSQCIDEMQGQSRRALELRYRQNLKPAEVAAQLGMQPGSVRVMLHRIRAALRQCIERRLGEGA